MRILNEFIIPKEEEIEVKESIKERNNTNLYPSELLHLTYTHDREDFVQEDKDGNFYNDLDDYDYQYKLLTNIL